ncbi:hypothetical protein [Phenylobacterium sp.]|uniref:hypothetical protein n=1 Tax=Phenylobacterium sp. TaxID=1871053 RepID=UPI00398393B9
MLKLISALAIVAAFASPATAQAPTTDLAAGIPTYGVSGIFYEPDLDRIHGLNERIGVESLYEGRDFLYRLVKVYAGQAS